MLCYSLYKLYVLLVIISYNKLNYVNCNTLFVSIDSLILPLLLTGKSIPKYIPTDTFFNCRVILLFADNPENTIAITFPLTNVLEY